MAATMESTVTLNRIGVKRMGAMPLTRERHVVACGVLEFI